MTLFDWLEVSKEIEPESRYFECKGVLFSAVRKGDALRIHVACSKSNMLNLRAGCAEFIDNMFSRFKWCKMLIATVSLKNKSVINLCLKLGFLDLGEYMFANGKSKIMVVKR